MEAALATAAGLAFVFFMSCLGAAAVFLFGKPAPGRVQQAVLGFAGGVMIAAAAWGLLAPAAEGAEALGLAAWAPVAGGFALGALFLLALDRAIPRMRLSGPRGPALLLSAVALHNIPEGMAVGLALALASQGGGGPEAYAGAGALALGIGIQNMPESAAVALALRQEGASRAKAFSLSAASGAVEPAFGAAAAILALQAAPAMPWLLSFAAGAMMYVVIEELIPEASPERAGGRRSGAGTLGAMVGFILMTALDLALAAP